MGCSQGKLRKVGPGLVSGMAKELSEEQMNKIIAYTNIQKEQVEAKYRTFLSKYPKGKISRKSFQVMLSDCLPGLSSERLAQLSNHIWRVYDINEDGHIDFYEFMTVLHVMSWGSNEDNLRQIFR